jgi:hypothetical protein
MAYVVSGEYLMILKKLKNMREVLQSRKSSGEGRFHFFDTGFHGDVYLLELVELILARCAHFVETGTNVGSTLAYAANRHPHLRCFSCEPDRKAYQHARKNTAGLHNVSLFNEASQSFLRKLLADKEALDGEVFFWLDAHGYGFQWPLREEISIITSNWQRAYIFIDDFLVPGLDGFAYEKYEEQVCSFDYIKGSLNPSNKYRLYYPAYTERTSKHHPLVGWGLIEFGHPGELLLSEQLARRTTKILVDGSDR